MDELERRPTSAISEAQLEQGGLGLRRPHTLFERCACGAIIAAEDDDPSIAEAVRFHNRSTRHEQWAIGAGLRPATGPGLR